MPTSLGDLIHQCLEPMQRRKKQPIPRSCPLNSTRGHLHIHSMCVYIIINSIIISKTVIGAEEMVQQMQSKPEDLGSDPHHPY